MNKKTLSILLLLITSIIWGSTFVAQKAGTSIGIFTYTSIRNALGFLTLLPVIYIMNKKSKQNNRVQNIDIQNNKNFNLNENNQKDNISIKLNKSSNTSSKDLIIGGTLCGIMVAIGSALQQLGMMYNTDVGKAAFITTLYIIIIPLLNTVLGKKIRPIVWIAVLIGIIGFYFLTMAGKSQSFNLEIGDLFILISAFVFSIQILLVDHFTTKCDGIKLSTIQLLIAAIVSIPPILLFEEIIIIDIINAWLPLIYAGILSSGIAFTLQIVGQRYAEPTAASLILSLEGIFAVFAGWIILEEALTIFEIIGSAIILLSVILAQMPTKIKKIKKTCKTLTT